MAGLQEAVAEANALLEAGDWRAAIPAIERVLLLNPQDTRFVLQLGYSHQQAGELDAALVAYRRIEDDAALAGMARYNIGTVHALRGEADAAFRELNRCVDAGLCSTEQLDSDTDLDSLRGDARFQQLWERMAAGG